MPRIETKDGIGLNVEETGDGSAIVFVHEFGGNQQSWEPQVRYFSRRYRCVTFNARGYPPSDVPEDVAQFSQAQAASDIREVMDGLGIDRAHVIGLSMGGFAVVHFGLNYPDRARSLVVAGAGYGAEKQFEEFFRENSFEVARQFELQGSEAYSRIYGMAASRIPFLVKDRRGWEEFRQTLATHSSKGVANTMRGVQANRPSLYDLEDKLKEMTVPTLIMVGDEDDHCLQPGLFMKRTIPASGLSVLPKTGHTLNLEEPALFNYLITEFLAQVEEDKWTARDPRSNPAEIMKTD